MATITGEECGVGPLPAERLRIGTMFPSTNTVVEPEFAAMLPRGVTAHGGRLPPARIPRHQLGEGGEPGGAQDRALGIDVVAGGAPRGERHLADN